MPTNTKALQVAEPAGIVAGKNAIINGGFDIWQRGTTVSFPGSTSSSYTADRWATATGTNQGVSVSRQATGDTTNLPNIQYCARYQRNSGWTGTDALNFAQSIETINSIPFAGKTVTLSFYARRGANYSASGNILTVYLIQGTGTDQNRISTGFTGESYPIDNQSAVLTTTWQRFTYTGIVGSSTTELAVYFRMTPTGTAGANDYFEITGVQLELGNVATPFSRAGGTIQGELAACQRYYWRTSNVSNSNYDTIIPIGWGNSTTQVGYNVQNPVPMRTTPSSIDYSTTYSDYSNVDYVNEVAVTAIGFDSGASSPFVSVMTASSASGLTQFRPYTLRAKSSGTPNAYIGFSAEL